MVMMMMTGDNVIKFPDPDEYTGPENEPETLVRIRIMDDGTIGIWSSDVIQTEDEIDYIKILLGEGLTAAFNYFNAIDDGSETSEGPLDDD